MRVLVAVTKIRFAIAHLLVLLRFPIIVSLSAEVIAQLPELLDKIKATDRCISTSISTMSNCFLLENGKRFFTVACRYDLAAVSSQRCVDHVQEGSFVIYGQARGIC